MLCWIEKKTDFNFEKKREKRWCLAKDNKTRLELTIVVERERYSTARTEYINIDECFIRLIMTLR